MSSAALDRAVLPFPAKTPPRATVKRLALGGLAFLIALATARYGHQWWTVGRLTETTPMSAAR